MVTEKTLMWCRYIETGRVYVADEHHNPFLQTNPWLVSRPGLSNKRWVFSESEFQKQFKLLGPCNDVDQIPEDEPTVSVPADPPAET